jgi:hypothetical protein
VLRGLVGDSGSRLELDMCKQCRLCRLAGYSVVQRNVTRLCNSYVPANCNEQCLLQAVDSILAAQAAAADSASKRKHLVATVVPAVVVPVGGCNRRLKSVVACVSGCVAWVWMLITALWTTMLVPPGASQV